LTGRFEKYKHRYVVRVSGTYLVVGWLLLQVMDITFSRIGLPAWTETLLLTTVALGFIPAVILGWAADLRLGRRDSTVVARPLSKRPMLDKGLPSIAVLPFANLSGDPAREYLADGMTDEIVTLLSQLPDIFIISHNSVLAFKNRDPDVRSIAEELCVRYILQGGVRQTDERVRVTAQLLEADSGTQLWADKYDGEEKSIFDMQDKVAQEIASILGGEILRKEIQRLEPGVQARG